MTGVARTALHIYQVKARRNKYIAIGERKKKKEGGGEGKKEKKN